MDEPRDVEQEGVVDASIFIRRLREERERAGVSQAELARRMSERLPSRIDPSTVTRMESGTRAVRLADALAAAQSLDVPLGDLLDAVGQGRRARIQELQFQIANAKWELDAILRSISERQQRIADLEAELARLSMVPHDAGDATEGESRE